MKRNVRTVICIILTAMLSTILSGCLSLGGGGADDASVLAENVTYAVEAANSVEASVSFEIQARIGDAGTSDGHTASIASDITVNSTFNPPAYHAEYFSRILVDGKTTREDNEFYVVPSDSNKNDYIRYEYDVSDDTWESSVLTHAEVAAIPVKTGLVQDWNSFFKNMYSDTEGVAVNDRVTDMYSGMVDSSIIQQLVGERVFGSFLHSVEQMINDELYCVIYIEQETYLPVQIFIDFTEEFIVSDMDFDSASITVDYSHWGSVGDISVPKKVEIVATNEDAEFYATYYAWNLFLPYLNGEVTGDTSTGGNEGLSFAAAWNTFQIRIDNALTTLPIAYKDLNNMGYVIDDVYATNIIEPNMYIENIPVYKGRDLIYCTFFNDTTEPLPIANCKIGCFDISASDQTENGIRVYLPGEVTLGISKDSLIAAYDEPTEIVSTFSVDTYIWRNGEAENQIFLAEISPVSNNVIRLQLQFIPVTGGKQ